MNHPAFVMRSLALVATTSSLAGVPAVDGALGHGAIMPEQPQKAPVQAFSKRMGLEFMAAPVMTLAPIDGPGLLLEDELATKDMPQRFAVQVPVQLSLADGQWIPAPGGRVWRCDIAGIDSLNARLHLTGLNLGAGQQVFLDDPNSDLGTVGPIEGRGSWGNGEAWGVFTPGAASRIEWFVPEGTIVTALPFDGIEYSHGYRDVFRVMAESFAAQCHNDPVCYPAWANQSNAAGRMTFTSAGASYLCSGQLMATTAADETPYFSTANH